MTFTVKWLAEARRSSTPLASPRPRSVLTGLPSRRTRSETSWAAACLRARTRRRLPVQVRVDDIVTNAARLGAATLACAAACKCFLFATAIEARPEMAPRLAVMVPLPVLLAVKVTGLPGFAENVPSTGDTDQRGVIA